jgi:hypothetical protein
MHDILNIRQILKITAIFLGIYFLSFLGYVFPILNNIIFWLIFFITLALSLKKIEYGTFILLTELFIGVKGYLFSFNIGGFVLSLRIALFILVFLIWFFRKSEKKIKFTETVYFPAYAFLTAFILIGIVTALINGNSIRNIFFDVNGYFYFALAFLLFDTLIDKEKIKTLFKIFIAASFAISILTLFISLEFTLFHQNARPDKAGSLSYEFAEEEEQEKEAEDISHGITAKSELESKEAFRDIRGVWIFRWTKDTGVGEITYIGGGLFRYFTPAQIYSLFTIIILLFYLLKQKFSLKLIRENIWLITIIVFSSLALLIGFSRSLWIGGFASFIFLLFFLPWKKSLKIVLSSIGMLFFLIIIAGTLLTPLYDIMADRINSIINPSEQSSAISRINLITPVFEKIKANPILGSGFGTVIQYKSVVPGHAGILKVFAFEWSYLDTITEIGILGLIMYLWFIWKIFKNGFHLNSEFKSKFSSREFNYKYLIVGLLATLFGLVITNITTPYLNHPLGIGYLLIICAAFVSFEKLNDISTHREQAKSLN